MSANKPPLPGIYLLVPVFVASLLYFTNLSKTDLWKPDEPRYALVAREMLDSDSFIVPRLDGAAYTEKPPLFFWIAAGFSKLTGGVNQLSMRLPPAICAIGAILLLIFFMRQFFDERSAMVGGVVLAVSPLFFWLARSGQIDMLFTLLISASLFSFYRWYASGKRIYLPLFYACMVLAALARGPLGILLPALIVLAFVLLRREPLRLRDMRLHIGVPIAAILLLAWYIPASRTASGCSIGAILREQLSGRALNAGEQGVRPYVRPFYSVAWLIAWMAPWSLLIPVAAISGVRARLDSARLFLLVWAAAVLVFATLMAGGRAAGLLPMYPAAAGLVGVWLCGQGTRGDEWLVRAVAFAWGLLLIAAGIAAIVAAPAFLEKRFPGVTLPASWKEVLVVWIASGAAAAAVALLGKEVRHYVSACVVTLVAVFITTYSNVLPWIDSYRSPRAACRRYVSDWQEGMQLGVLGNLDYEYAFYARVKLASCQELKEYFAAEEVRFCFVSNEDYQQALAEHDFPMYELDKWFGASRVTLLLCNRNLNAH